MGSCHRRSWLGFWWHLLYLHIFRRRKCTLPDNNICIFCRLLKLKDVYNFKLWGLGCLTSALWILHQIVESCLQLLSLICWLLHALLMQLQSLTSLTLYSGPLQVESVSTDRSGFISLGICDSRLWFFYRFLVHHSFSNVSKQLHVLRPSCTPIMYLAWKLCMLFLWLHRLVFHKDSRT